MEILVIEFKLLYTIFCLVTVCDTRWDELGRYDIPAVIEYILAKSGQQKISYIGFSLGCAMFFIAMIHQPELNSKIEMMIALAPATTIANTRSSIRYLGPYVRLFEVSTVYLYYLELSFFYGVMGLIS